MKRDAPAYDAARLRFEKERLRYDQLTEKTSKDTARYELALEQWEEAIKKAGDGGMPSAGHMTVPVASVLRDAAETFEIGDDYELGEEDSEDLERELYVHQLAELRHAFTVVAADIAASEDDSYEEALLSTSF